VFEFFSGNKTIYKFQFVQFQICSANSSILNLINNMIIDKQSILLKVLVAVIHVCLDLYFFLSKWYHCVTFCTCIISCAYSEMHEVTWCTWFIKLITWFLKFFKTSFYCWKFIFLCNLSFYFKSIIQFSFMVSKTFLYWYFYFTLFYSYF